MRNCLWGLRLGLVAGGSGHIRACTDARSEPGGADPAGLGAPPILYTWRPPKGIRRSRHSESPPSPRVPTRRVSVSPLRLSPPPCQSLRCVWLSGVVCPVHQAQAGVMTCLTG